MLKKLVLFCATTAALSGSFSAAVFANTSNVVPPVHWGSHPYSNAANAFTSGKKFCGNKYRGKKTCIPVINNTDDLLTINTASYSTTTSPAGNTVALIGKDSVPSTIFTVVDTTPDGKTNTIYSGPANNREGIACNKDDTAHTTACTAWK